MVTGVSSLLKTVKDVESEAGKGVRTLENAIDAIEEAVKVIIILQCDWHYHDNVVRRNTTQIILQNVMLVLKI